MMMMVMHAGLRDLTLRCDAGRNGCESCHQHDANLPHGVMDTDVTPEVIMT